LSGFGVPRCAAWGVQPALSMKTRALTIAMLALFAACSQSASQSPGDEAGPGKAGSGGGADSGRLDASGGASSGSSSSGGSSSGGGTGDDGPSPVGQIDGGVSTALPPLPELGNVSATVEGDGVRITFDPVDGALDYRVYPLPADGDISPQSDGTIVVKNAVYRCAGAREDLYMVHDGSVNDNAAGGATVVTGTVDGYSRSESADSTLGYVYTTPGPGRAAVYVLAAGDVHENQCGRPQFTSIRPNTYTTDASVRAQLLAAHARDDGIAFYVPAAASSGTHPVYEGTVNSDVLRWIDGPEAMARGSGKTLFNVVTTATTDTAPLRRVSVQPYCLSSHDELVAGSARYVEVRDQGDQPATALHWAGLTATTTLVVEALGTQCPYQGLLSPTHLDAADGYPAYLTLADMQAASMTGEVFVNGQADSTVRPKALARSFVAVTPAKPAMDFYDDFMSPLPAFQERSGGNTDKYFTSSVYEFDTTATHTTEFGTMLGEFWATYADEASDENGKIRLTAMQKANLDASTYLHVVTSVDFLSTDRRYPQIIVSDQSAPVQDNLASGKTLIVQPKSMAPTYMQVQVCDHRTWDVNNQCPLLPTFSTQFAPPALMPSEYVGTDRSVKVDVYVSGQRIYVLLDDAPYSCTSLPAVADDGSTYTGPTGAVTVTLGDVLYHSGVDISVAGGALTAPNSYIFHRNHMQTVTRRHFDNFGFSSGVAAPAWDETRFPCVNGQ
jgi:hypothetical protein